MIARKFTSTWNSYTHAAIITSRTYLYFRSFFNSKVCSKWNQ